MSGAKNKPLDEYQGRNEIISLLDVQTGARFSFLSNDMVDQNIGIDKDGNIKIVPLSSSVSLLYGTKKSGIDGGSIGEIYFDDDYLYICTKAGVPGVAVWKKVSLANT